MVIITLTSATSCTVTSPLICRGVLTSLDCSGNKLNFTPASALKKKRNIQACLKISGSTSTGQTSSPTESQKTDQEIINQLLVPRELDDHMIDEPYNGRLLEGGLVFHQNFAVRSYEIGSDCKLSIETLMNYLQETSLNHLKILGVMADGFGTTLAMSAEDLIWVMCWSHVEVDHYPSWDDIVQVNSWMYRSGKKSYCRDWLIRDLKTGRILMQATSLYTMMNKKTRKFAKASDEVLGEMKSFIVQCSPLTNKDSRNRVHLDTDNSDYVRSCLTTGWTDMDVNQHVSHIKLVNCVLESVPRSVVETHELSAMTLEYQKECNGDTTLQSLSKLCSNHSIDNHGIEFDHLLLVESGPELVRGITKWRPKYTN